MAYPRREIRNNAVYHVYTRCVNHQFLFNEPWTKDLLIAVIEETMGIYDFELNGFVIMSNHIHLILKTLNKNHPISKIMQRIKSVYAKRYNKIMNRKGPFWNDRYGSNIINFFLSVNCYVGFNPVRAGMVDDPLAEEYSSYRCYFDKDFKGKLKITLHPQFLNLGKTFEDCAEKYHNYEQIYFRTNENKFIN